MTRQKKTRKPKATVITAPKSSKDALFSSKDKKPKKKTGLKSGNKQQIATKKSKENRTATEKDPRLGSKKPIVLIKETAKPKTTSKPVAEVPLAQVKTLVPLTVEEKIAAIENDERLWAITEQQEQGQALSEADVLYYNEKMDEYQKLTEELDVDALSEEQAPVDTDSLSEEQLWQKFNDDDFSLPEQD